MRRSKSHIGRIVFSLEAFDELGQPGLPLRSGRLDIQKAGHPGRQSIFVFQPRHILAWRYPTIALPINANEYLTLIQICPVQATGRVWARPQLEENRYQSECLHRPLDSRPLV